MSTRVTVLLLGVLLGCGTSADDASTITLIAADSGPDLAALIPGPPSPIVALVFGSVDCPVSNTLLPEVERIHRDAAELGVPVYLVHTGRDVTEEEARRHADEYALTLPVLLDPDHVLVRHLGATTTPEAFVLREPVGDAKIVYQGRLNDLYVGLGQRRAEATQHHLRLGIEAALERRLPDQVFVEPVGCLIE